MKTDPSYLPTLAKIVASQMQHRPWAQDADWNNIALNLLPGSGSLHVKRLIHLAKQAMKKTHQTKLATRQNARLRKKERKNAESAKNKKRLIKALKTKADEAWRGDLWSLNYTDFLLTPFWKIVREIKLRHANFSCEWCGFDKFLQVHHKTYAHRGTEHEHLGDLEVLCSTCHKRHHKIE